MNLIKKNHINFFLFIYFLGEHQRGRKKREREGKEGKEKRKRRERGERGERERKEGFIFPNPSRVVGGKDA